MKISASPFLRSTTCIVAALLLHGPSAAQGLDQLKGILGGGSNSGSNGDNASSSLPSLGGLGAGALGSGALGSASVGNAAGVIQYCIKNNYLGGADAASVKDRLLDKLSGGNRRAAAKDPGYASGVRGILGTSDGQRVDLTGGGLKAEVTRRVCDQVLDRAKSMF